MGVFDAQVQTALAVPDPRTDWKLPLPWALNYSAITGHTALAGTNGHDTLLLSGNRDRQMNGNESTRVTQNRTHQVGGNQQKQIAGNKNENVVGNFLQTTIGNLHRSIVGATNDLHTGVHTIAHKANQLLHEPVEYMHYIEKITQTGTNYSQMYGFYYSVVGTYTNFVGLNTDFKLMQLGVTAAEASMSGVSTSNRAIRLKDALVESRFQAVEAQVGAMEPAVYVSMLHEVAFTQKIIIIGVNQYI